MTQANFIHEGKAIDYTPGSDVSAGQVVVLGSMIGIAKIDIPSGRTGALYTVGVYDVAKATGAISAGGKVFWDADGNPVGGTAGTGAAASAAGTGNVFMGFAVAAAAEADETVRTLLIGSDDLGDIPVAANVADADALTASDPAASAVDPDAMTAATLTEDGSAIGGTNDGDLPALVDPAGDSGASLIAGVRENSAMINAAIVDMTSIRTQLVAALDDVGANNTAIVAAIDDLDALRTTVNAILTVLQNAGLMASE